MRIIAIAPVFALALAPLFAQSTVTPPLPRKAPEIAIAEPGPDGKPVKTTQLSSYKGKVVVLALVSTICPHCQKECEMLSKVYTDMKPKGVQMLAVAFNDNAALLVPQFVREHGVLFPVGSAPPDVAAGFLGFSVMDRYVVPQIAVIDRNGMIRAQTPPAGDPNLQDEGFLRNLIGKLVAEPAGGPATTTKAAPKTAPKTAPKNSSN
jgi:peroxiredoxin